MNKKNSDRNSCRKVILLVHLPAEGKENCFQKSLQGSFLEINHNHFHVSQK